eukprot:gnl/Carplike_NY0171/5882_a8054_188.p1 GENE.gnl/Carplike_NY0171/5882_a8054_188~~gnl/Carplike_NY0171/5882_a8054_188.p1  ORF type:complete len:623 (+),score=192.75 gnl/Carplike_NY0171/5882_a8054_188:53-1921(+)
MIRLGFILEEILKAPPHMYPSKSKIEEWDRNFKSELEKKAEQTIHEQTKLSGSVSQAIGAVSQLSDARIPTSVGSGQPSMSHWDKAPFLLSDYPSARNNIELQRMIDGVDYHCEEIMKYALSSLKRLEQHQCKICGRVYPSEEMLERHNRITIHPTRVLYEMEGEDFDETTLMDDDGSFDKRRRGEFSLWEKRRREKMREEIRMRVEERKKMYEEARRTSDDVLGLDQKLLEPEQHPSLMFRLMSMSEYEFKQSTCVDTVSRHAVDMMLKRTKEMGYKMGHGALSLPQGSHTIGSDIAHGKRDGADVSGTKQSPLICLVSDGEHSCIHCGRVLQTQWVTEGQLIASGRSRLSHEERIGSLYEEMHSFEHRKEIALRDEWEKEKLRLEALVGHGVSHVPILDGDEKVGAEVNREQADTEKDIDTMRTRLGWIQKHLPKLIEMSRKRLRERERELSASNKRKKEIESALKGSMSSGWGVFDVVEASSLSLSTLQTTDEDQSTGSATDKKPTMLSLVSGYIHTDCQEELLEKEKEEKVAKWKAIEDQWNMMKGVSKGEDEKKEEEEEGVQGGPDVSVVSGKGRSIPTAKKVDRIEGIQDGKVRTGFIFLDDDTDDYQALEVPILK